jgi:hypothetical protein
MLVLSLPNRGNALEAAQREAIDRLAASVPPGQQAPGVLARHYAVLLWVEDYCNGRSSESVRNYLTEKGSADRNAFEAAWLDAIDMLGKTEPQAMCSLALDQYGPKGVQIPDAWAPKPAAE